ncbi:MAG TPA: exodeoxyribonuclease VII large subunit [Thermoanaerobaculia bacterium]|nr:exodeoxyribonuclease VII large subunit [Thermoanaerobaculia bacterium]HUM29554.1 exodeoxyribonuclease VII large subunit [Thermoanaerobaculia bacterium]HXK67937.1 exodeoxyribonuclease VII large subunit [Thermoanaerobaculia bacterium]
MRIYTVSELLQKVQWTLEDTFGTVTVRGEVSQCTRSRSGHIYLTLKDASSALSSVIWSTTASRLPFQVEEGLSFLATGRLTIYAPQGRFQMVISHLVPDGIGALQLAFEQLKKKLAAEGLFDGSRKRSLPALPLRVGLITSPTGAAIRDFLAMVSRAPAPLDITLYPVRVQGELAAKECIRGLEVFASLNDVDVIVITRGGGSLEDLQPFNEESLARAVAASPIPVISAVGHEVDMTICDMVADLRCPTPTAAGETLARRMETEVQRISDLEGRLQSYVRGWFDEEIRNLQILRRHLNLNHLSRRVLEARENLNRMRLHIRRGLTLAMDDQYRCHRERAVQVKEWMTALVLTHAKSLPTRRQLFSLLRQNFKRNRDFVSSLSRQLKLLGPRQVLARGYSITRKKDTTIVKCSTDVDSGEILTIMLHEGNLTCRVNEKD